ncbi:YhdH/YhfP family quinone oxidoreductase [Gracilimonas mengyeensis]|uniref:Putative quinone oxidoreductase, YhdH/YhfP family n=1 Tax=Gracilimonas mengyeensis TaxID=1302730 RepID=A0A521EMK3_9BACT|nr:YhdH/YhfP family quinone oxidoreductase [Gracilimonas mengyeensis]SMO84681.1 putative quinone oxidoreductase, YhdH/YhfP family [Gracilimonas mengyeensis]
MSEKTFQAFYVEEQESGAFTSGVKKVPFSFLPDHEVLIEVHFSCLNYKDALSASGNKGVTRSYPHIPGIDAAGVVVEDVSGKFDEGDSVLVTGRDLGSNTSGGYGRFIRVPNDWVVPMPDGLDAKQAMTYGTAGFTAMYGVKRLQRELIEAGNGKVLVTGATGGVGSMAVFFLSQLGYKVIAATGKMEKKSFLETLGAAEVIHRDKVTDVKESPILSRQWQGAIETVGGEMLDAVIRQAGHDGAVACCGNILGHELHTNVYPFILRGVSLLGIDSAICKTLLRLEIWDTISEMPHQKLPESYSHVVGLNELSGEIEKILNGEQSGRVVVSHQK